MASLRPQKRTRITELETTEFGQPVTLYRYECSCGRKGVYSRDVSRAMMRAFDHRCRVARLRQPA
jgi:hypothetical protein